MECEKWMKQAVDRIQNKLTPNQIFEVKSLFEGYEWESLSKGERIIFGKYFANEVREGNVKNVSAIERGRNNHSKYIKNEVDQQWRH